MYLLQTNIPLPPQLSPDSLAVKEAQLQEIVDTIRTVCPEGRHYGDVAILVRNNKEGSEVAACLVAEGIPVVSDDSLYVKASVTVRRLVSEMSVVVVPPEIYVLPHSGQMAVCIETLACNTLPLFW